MSPLTVCDRTGLPPEFVPWAIRQARAVLPGKLTGRTVIRLKAVRRTWWGRRKSRYDKLGLYSLVEISVPTQPAPTIRWCIRLLCLVGFIAHELRHAYDCQLWRPGPYQYHDPMTDEEPQERRARKSERLVLDRVLNSPNRTAYLTGTVRRNCTPVSGTRFARSSC